MKEETATFINKIEKIHAPLLAEAKNTLEVPCGGTIGTINPPVKLDLIKLYETDASDAKAQAKRAMELLDEAGSFFITVTNPNIEPATPIAKRGRVSMNELLASIYKSATFKGATVEDDPNTGTLRFFGWRKRSTVALKKAQKSKTKTK